MTGDIYASLADIETAAQWVEAAIHPASLPWMTGSPATKLQSAANLIGHAHDYYATAGMDGLAAESGTTRSNLLSIAANPPSTPQGIYAAVWSPPVSQRGTLGGLWERAIAARQPWYFSPWYAYGWIAFTLGGLALSATVARRGPTRRGWGAALGRL